MLLQVRHQIHLGEMIKTLGLNNTRMRLWTGPRFRIKMSSYQYRKSHCWDKTVVRSSYLHNGISYICKAASLFWIAALFTNAYVYIDSAPLVTIGSISVKLPLDKFDKSHTCLEVINCITRITLQSEWPSVSILSWLYVPYWINIQRIVNT